MDYVISQPPSIPLLYVHSQHPPPCMKSNLSHGFLEVVCWWYGEAGQKEVLEDAGIVRWTGAVMMDANGESILSSEAWG